MLPSELKDDVLELAGIAKECPDGLKEKCFELLLGHYLRQLELKDRASNPKQQAQVPSTNTEGINAITAQPDQQVIASEHDLAITDVHVKARKFLEKYGKTINDLNQVFYKEAGELRPLYEDLKTTKTSESQIRIALLHSLLSGINSGEFEFNGEEVRKECQVRKCYDANNFSANFKNNANLFDSFDKYDKHSPAIRLSEAGRGSLANVIVELQ